jgi:hypothetical protein
MYVANSDASGEHYTASWTRLQGVSIREVSKVKAHKSRTQIVAESQILANARDYMSEISPKK